MSESGSEDDAAAMAAAMGFSSFGASKQPNKKRKFNTATDAFIDGQELEKVDRGGKKGKGSGGNDIPLGRPRTFGQKINGGGVVSPRNNDAEIPMEDEDEEEQSGGVYLGSRPVEGILVEGKEIVLQDGEDGPRYLDTSQPAPIEAQSLDTEKSEAQAQIDAILDSIEPLPTSLLPLPPGSAASPPASLQPSITSPHISNLPQRPPPSFHDSRRGGFGGNKGGRGGGNQGGQRNPTWYIDYYDPSFNENPWAQLEQENGLQSVGTWMKRGHWQKGRSGN
jgi:hypothetical protein